MTLSTRTWVRAGLALVLTAASTWAAAQTTAFTATYRGGSSSLCGTTCKTIGSHEELRHALTS